MVYGVYDNSALVHWPPSKIFVDEIRVRFVLLVFSMLPEADACQRSSAHSRRRTASPER